MTDRGLSLVEVMVVVTIGVLILLPTINFMTMSQKTAYQGFDRLETLGAARQILESVQRDLKSSCEAGLDGFTTRTENGKTSYEFPAFPNGPGANVFPTSINPANRVTYVFDPTRKEVSRKVEFHPSLGLSRAQNERVLARNVASFTILPTSMFGMPVFEVDVLCVPSHPTRRTAQTRLRSSIRSEHRSRLSRHRWFLENQATKIDVR